ncbi:uncharacterized protein LOC116189491 isoform X2 [Punica granatum]|uniref:Uncharacterized protein LOC116189491 isoform X2 n=1 Tax=Punica granatum TaxID=22663 RepID=A0A6P8BVR0_PUNGR|nr:uncharacterized protein LOC116189491 isoform X2 [Punica granatum]
MADDGEGYAAEEAKKRCRRVIDSIGRLPSSTPDSCKRTLLRLAQAELSFLSRRPSPSSSSSSTAPLSINIGHLEAILHILWQPFINGVSRVCKPITGSPATKGDRSSNSGSKTAYADIVCIVKGKPVWIIVSDRNPKYVSWDGCSRHKGLKSKIEQVLAAAQSSLTLRPSSVVLFFSKGVDGRILEEIEHQFGASKFEMGIPDFDFAEERDGEWINIVMRSFQESVALEIKVDEFEYAALASESGVRCSTLGSEATEVSEERSSSDAFAALISGLKPSVEMNEMEIALSDDLQGGGKLINFDTTALVALVSEISNDGAEKILSKSNDELRQRFKGNVDFVIEQAKSQLQNPIHVELGLAMSMKRGMICETVLSEFKELVSMCGGPREKLRADQLVKRLMYRRAGSSFRSDSEPSDHQKA